MSKGKVHVVSKQNNKDHSTVSYDLGSRKDQLPLGPNSVRVRTALISLTSNNLTYARLGDFLGWWSTFPLPRTLPAPFNDPQDYGIVPAWGFGHIISSNIANLQPGSLLWGFWPTSGAPFDLELKSSEPPGSWQETSEHRKHLMTLYNVYRPQSLSTADLESLPQEELDTLAFQANVGAVSVAGIALSQYVLGPDPIHPAGDGGWTAADADVSEAVVIALSAGDRTARTFIDAFLHERERSLKPLGLLAVTAGVSADLVAGAEYPSMTIGYAESSSEDMMAWVEGLKPRRVVIADFGARGNALQDLLAALEKRMPEIETMVIAIGGEAKIYSQEELERLVQNSQAMSKEAGWVRMNTSPLLDAAAAKLGAEKVHQHLGDVWERFVERGGLRGLGLVWGEGIEGEKGIEGRWEKLCTPGRVAGEECLVYEV
ncbi:hypothetical protein MBLNU230_g8042t1 [Neophaeotheca triangularis]